MDRINTGIAPQQQRNLASALLFSLMLPFSPLQSSAGEDMGKSIFVNAGEGIRIHCIEKGAGKSILFVPGWTMPGEIWEQQIKHFSRGYRVVAIDPRAQGQSSQTTNGLSP